VLGVEPKSIALSHPNLEIIAEPYRSEHLAGTKLAFAAATAEVNRRVVVDAKARGIWVNSASDPSEGDFHLPATWRDGPITLTVSTDGSSPTLAATLRDRAAASLGPGAAGLAVLLAELRPQVLATIGDLELRRQALIAAADPKWLDHFAKEGPESTRESLRREIGLD
jgi:siroheme synthase-like protein